MEYVSLGTAARQLAAPARCRSGSPADRPGQGVPPPARAPRRRGGGSTSPSAGEPPGRRTVARPFAAPPGRAVSDHNQCSTTRAPPTPGARQLTCPRGVPGRCASGAVLPRRGGEVGCRPSRRRWRGGWRRREALEWRTATPPPLPAPRCTPPGRARNPVTNQQPPALAFLVHELTSFSQALTARAAGDPADSAGGDGSRPRAGRFASRRGESRSGARRARARRGCLRTCFDERLYQPACPGRQ